jgi:hypothetical protein
MGIISDYEHIAGPLELDQGRWLQRNWSLGLCFGAANRDDVPIRVSNVNCLVANVGVTHLFFGRYAPVTLVSRNY